MLVTMKNMSSRNVTSIMGVISKSAGSGRVLRRGWSSHSSMTSPSKGPLMPRPSASVRASRNWAIRSSTASCNFEMRFCNRLPASTIGIAIVNPIAVVESAKLISEASSVGSVPVFPAAAITLKAEIMPVTVPSSPSIGAVFTMVETQLVR